MSTPFSFSGSLNYPPDAGMAVVSVAIAMSGQFDSAEPGQVLKLTSSGTHSVDLGTLPTEGLKGLLIKVDAGGAAVKVKINGSSVAEEISAGGFKALGSPSPVDGVTSIDLDYEDDTVVRLWVFG